MGGWKRTLSKHAVTVEATAFKPLGREERSELAGAVARFAAHLELEGELALARP